MNAILTTMSETGNAAIQTAIDQTMYNVGDGNGIWYLIGAALVFFMQCGFAMVETGMTRAKNAGNIIMKNLMHRHGGFHYYRVRAYAWGGRAVRSGRSTYS